LVHSKMVKKLKMQLDIPKNLKNLTDPENK
jgi:hypothetical protein